MGGRRRGQRAGFGLVKRLAAVVGVCLAIRLAADAVSPGGIRLPAALGRAVMALELPSAGPERAGNPSERILSGELPGKGVTGETKTGSQLTGGERETTFPVATQPSEPARPTETAPAPETSVPLPTAPGEPEVPLKDAIPTTIKGSGEADAGGVYIKNKTNYTVDVASLLAKPLDYGASPAVLIVHTHASEAYNPAGEDIYEESDPSRTEDLRFNVVRVGDELQKTLEARGVTVYHDRQLHDYPSYNGAYNRSMASVQTYLEAHSDIKVVIDLHRDALEGDGKLYKTVAQVGDVPCAQVMLICGTDQSGLAHPNWRENMTLAVKIQSRMARTYPTLARPLKLSTSRYNQHVSPGALLAEIGTNGNTLKEALAAAQLFGQCLADVLTGASG